LEKILNQIEYTTSFVFGLEDQSNLNIMGFLYDSKPLRDTMVFILVRLFESSCFIGSTFGFRVAYSS
jgi:hypothetical protein